MDVPFVLNHSVPSSPSFEKSLFFSGSALGEAGFQ